MEGVMHAMSEKALKIADNVHSLVREEIGLQDLDCNDVDITYRVYTILCEALDSSGVNVQCNLPPLLRLLDPDIVLPAKISNFTRKVKKAVEKDSSIQDEVIRGIYKKSDISAELTSLGVTIDGLKKGEVTSSSRSPVLKLRHALEIRSLALSHGVSFQKVVSILTDIMTHTSSSRPAHGGAESVNVLRTQLTNIHRQQQRLLHLCRTAEWNELMNKPYRFLDRKPVPTVCSPVKPSRKKMPVSVLVTELISCYQTITTVSKQLTSLAQNAKLHSSNIKTVNKDYANLKTKYERKLGEIQTLKEKLASATPRNSNKKIKRRDMQVQTLKETITDKQQIIDERDTQLSNAEEQIERLTASLKDIKTAKLGIQKCRSYWKRNAMEASNRTTGGGGENVQKITELENTTLAQEEFIAELLQEKCLQTFKDGRYTDDVRQVYMNLISQGVPIQKVKEVVQNVLEGFLHVGVDRLPGKTSASMMAVEAQVIAQAQVAEAMLSETNSTLHLDGTRKRFREYGSFQVSTNSRSYSLGISEMLTGDAKSFLDETLHILEQMSEVVSDQENEKQTVKAKLLQSISNLMTDRSVVNKKYCSDLELVRKDVFGLLHDNWDQISEDDKDELSRVNNLYCGLHVVANMATAAQVGLKEYEAEMMTENANYQDGASSVIWQCSKALTPGGDQKSGCAEEFAAFMEGKNEKSDIASFSHNRFNILFHNGGVLFYNHQHILEFLNSGCPNSNKLLKAIQTNLAQQSILAECQALGLVDKIITGPLWRLLEQKNRNIFSLNDQWLKLVEYLDANAVDPTPLLNGNSVFTDEVATITKDHLYNELLAKPSRVDTDATKKALKYMCTKMSVLVKRQLKDQLPGGKFHLPSVDIIEAARSSPLTNKISEADFSDLDRLVVRAPQKSTVSKSASICFTRNKTGKWLKSLSATTKAKYIKKARTLAPSRKKMTFFRMKLIRAKRRQLQQERCEKSERLLRQKQQRLDALKRRVEQENGLFETEAIVRQNLQSLSAKQMQERCKDQISYKRDVLMSTIPHRRLVQWSYQQKMYTVRELSENLIELIRANWPDGAPQYIKTLNQTVGHDKQTDGDRVQQDDVTPPVEDREQPDDNRRQPDQTRSQKRKRVKEKDSCEKKKRQRVDATSCTVGCYVAVAFEGGKWFPGLVESVGPDSRITLKYMHPSGRQAFLWPDPEDRGVTDMKYIFANITVNPRDSGGRLWRVEELSAVQKAYQSYAKTYFQE